MEVRNSEDGGNIGPQGEPPDQTIPSRSYQSPNLTDKCLQGTEAADQQSVGLEPAGLKSVGLESMGQQPAGKHSKGQQSAGQQSYAGNTEFIQGQAPYQGHVQYVMSPGYPENTAVQYIHPGYAPVQQNYTQPGVIVPAGQYIVRDTRTPMHLEKEEDRPTVQPSMASIIFKRIVTTLFIVMDLVLNWSQFISWVADVELPKWMSFFEFVSSVKSGSVAKALCDKGTDSLTIMYSIFVILGTGWTMVRLTNIVGETVLEYQKRHPSETEPKCRGFQIIHGWVESVLALVLDDLPQAILLVVFSSKCTIDNTSLLKVGIWTLIKVSKNRTRKSFCKQIYRPCCDGACDDCCCVYRCDCICCCKIFFCRPLGCLCNKPVFEVRDYNICPECTFFRGDRCFGEIETDPEWADSTFSNLEKLHLVLGFAFIIIVFLKNFFTWLRRF